YTIYFEDHRVLKWDEVADESRAERVSCRGTWVFPSSVPGTLTDRGLCLCSAQHLPPWCCRRGAALHLRSPAHHRVRSMAAEEEWVCPICRDARKDIAYAMPCRHEFCLGCILRWGKQQDSCPLCRRVMEVVKVAALED
uniref:RING-type domain-containing protein n=1 Tax=Phasianus colchicus TaxID=9054 RepID=A0A669QIG4_PHACC